MAEQNGSSSLLDVLIKSILAIGIGFASVRSGAVEPSKGHTVALGFFVGKIALPLLTFNTIATSEFGDLNWMVIVATAGAKVIIYFITFTVIYLAYLPHRLRGQRILTANVFAVFCVATMDFPMGLPVINAVYGPKMVVYLAANAFVGTCFLTPIAMLIFETGRFLQQREDAGDGEPPSIWSAVARIFLNPLMCCTVAGVLYSITLTWTLVEADGSRSFPHPISDVISFLTAPFATMALFLVGTTLTSADLNFWSLFLVLMKVVVCAFLSYFLAIELIPESGETGLDLRSLTFFYGCIPAGTVVLVLALQYDPAVLPLIASAILLGLCVSGPIMYTSSIILECRAKSEIHIVQIVQECVAAASLCLGTMGVAMLTAMWARLSFLYRVVLLYGVVVTLYACITVGIRLEWIWMGCQRNPTKLIFAFLQNECRFLVLFLMLLVGTKSLTRTSWSPYRWWILGVCAFLVLVPSVIVEPNTFDILCGMYGSYSRRRLCVLLAWTVCIILCAAGLAARAIRRGHRTTDALDLLGNSVVRTLGILLGLRSFMQIVDITAALFWTKLTQSYSVMQILENLFEHGQGVVWFFIVIKSVRPILGCEAHVDIAITANVMQSSAIGCRSESFLE